jgi:hypothetical protein
VVESWMLPAGVDANVDGKPMATANTSAGAAADAGEAGRWGDDDTPSGTSEEHYRMELLEPFPSCSHCGRESHHPR